MPSLLGFVLLLPLAGCFSEPTPPPALEPEPAAPPPAAPAPPPPTLPEGPPSETTAPPGGWIQDEVIYDAQGNVYGCYGGGNWCSRAPALDPVTHKPRN